VNPRVSFILNLEAGLSQKHSFLRPYLPCGYYRVLLPQILSLQQNLCITALAFFVEHSISFAIW
jgi:hypothetical protein